METVKLSILDTLSQHGESPSVRLTSSIAQAQLADRLGFERYWLTEHHTWCGDSSPEVLLPLMAATTHRIKIGTAGVLMNFYRPYKVARTFQLLENLFSGRIDLGICRGGLSNEVGQELRDTTNGAPTMEEFAARAESLFNHLAQGTRDGSGNGAPQAWLLGSGSASMRLATKLGSSYCHSLTHKGYDRDPGILAAFHNALPVNDIRQSALLVSGICAPSARQADELLSRHYNPSLEANVVGTPGACADQIYSIAHQYQVERIVWLDLSATRVELQRSITLLADAMALNH